MHASKQAQRLDIRKKRFQKIVSQAFFLGFVESESLLQILLRRCKDFYLQAIESRISFLA